MKKWLVYLGAISVFLLLLHCGWERNKSMNNDIKEGPKVDKTEASVISEIFIKNLMKYPDDVSFDKASKKVYTEPNNVFKVTGHLKANNTFGQAIPYIYNFRIRYNGGDWSDIRGGKPINWTFMGGNIYNEATQEFTEYDSQEQESQ